MKLFARFLSVFQFKNWGAFKSWANLDLLHAFIAILAVVAVFSLFLTVSGCTTAPEYQPRLEFGAHIELDQNKPVVGHDPVGMARLIKPVYVHPLVTVNAEYLHLSSIPDNDDLNTVDQAGITFTVPLGRRPPSVTFVPSVSLSADQCVAPVPR
jgi:hypothetical protein